MKREDALLRAKTAQRKQPTNFTLLRVGCLIRDGINHNRHLPDTPLQEATILQILTYFLTLTFKRTVYTLSGKRDLNSTPKLLAIY